jgi:hypothetical protein
MGERDRIADYHDENDACDGHDIRKATKQRDEKKQNKEAMIALANAIVYSRTMMIKPQHAIVTSVAMLAPLRPIDAADLAKLITDNRRSAFSFGRPMRFVYGRRKR